ncbi:hypothetical protein J2T38_002254 [Neisseria perflava]|uniref:IgG-binding virulence factor TspB family protein n=1 Tax=Neisseria perflava TaxID=33053 RepID=UPI00209F74A9|nr:hypothetical protein [Neisseria perflava]
MTYKKQSVAHWYSSGWSKSAISDSAYRNFQTQAMKVRYEKALSASSVPVGLEAGVSRATVLKNLFSNFKKFRFGGGFWTWAAFTAVGFAIDKLLEDDGYTYSDSGNNYTKNYACTVKAKYRTTVYETLGVSDSECSRELGSAIGTYLCQKHFSWSGYTFSGFNTSNGNCEFSKGSDVRSKGNITFTKNPITTTLQDETLERIIGKALDNATSTALDKYIQATADENGDIPGLDMTISVPAGTVVTIGPYTDTDGKVKQATITFQQSESGETTADVQEEERPDLTPNSEEAPSVEPEEETGTGSGSETGTGTGTGSSTGTSTGTDTGTSTRTETQPQEQSFLCDLFPDILACQKMGEPSEETFEEISIPQATDDTTWKPDSFLAPNGVCPQLKSFSVWGKSVEISYEPLCVLMEQVRFAVLLAFIVISAYISFGGLRSKD